MNKHHPQSENKPDIEHVMESIRSSRSMPSRQSSDSSHFTAIATEDNLRANLAAANETCLLQPRGSGLRGLYNRLLFKLLHTLIFQINDFHAYVVRVLNKTIRVLEGEDPAVSELTQLHRRRITVTEMLAERLAEYDAMHIEERLQKLENALFAQNHPKSQ